MDTRLYDYACPKVNINLASQWSTRCFCILALGYFRFQVKICHDQQVNFWGFCYEWIEFVCEGVHVHVVFSTRLSRGHHASGDPTRLISSLAGTNYLRISIFPSGRTAWSAGSPDPGTSQDCWEIPVHLWDYAPIRCLNTHRVLASLLKSVEYTAQQHNAFLNGEHAFNSFYFCLLTFYSSVN